MWQVQAKRFEGIKRRVAKKRVMTHDHHELHMAHTIYFAKSATNFIIADAYELVRFAILPFGSCTHLWQAGARTLLALSLTL